MVLDLNYKVLHLTLYVPDLQIEVLDLKIRLNLSPSTVKHYSKWLHVSSSTVKHCRI